MDNYLLPHLKSQRKQHTKCTLTPQKFHLQGIYSKKIIMLGDMDKHLGRKMFITTLFIMNKILKQSKSTIRRNWLNKW